ncbi:MAG: exodeoxyribonuclease III [Gammaproteobacteria bacterium]|jgi:exodeoxyribonuclease-3|nr:exodeoxyribonuclease III [Gammaproteobacteria bacterium]MBT3859539.1 exodeoxyribonuclease III [Gammaproteobacteria bacterium]MBT3986567.1 exodeoxyribonuclease III [Gammaproteobacteria bacterium]MBT4256650.1 exodeoxyribonuclease III [Gammaproteobacteria bacterium]MBT4581089.1 exodeoxyribonuclease III [Gammaproteobacteria bacterium]
MRVMTLNCNGVRAAARKGFFDWLPTVNIDVVCLQETKAQIDQLSDPIFHPEEFDCHYYDAEKKGYSGTAIFCRKTPDKISRGLGFEIADTEGRYIQADFGDLSVASLYLPSGSSSEERLQRKYRFMDDYKKHMEKLSKSGRQYIICGDWNICHKEIDLKNWKPNQKNSGFLPEERQWLDSLYEDLDFADAFRIVNQEADQYSWWSNRGQARANNVGWRLDYHLITPGLADGVVSAEIYRDQSFSDHAPVIIEYKIA